MKFRVIFNETKDWAKKIAADAELFLKNSKQELVNEKEDICIIIGGDGTIFYHKDKVHGAVFAIGSERSKVCQANDKNWKTILGKALKMKKPLVEERTAISIKINGKEAGWAINDAVVHSRKHNFIRLAVNANNATHEFGGDGVIVATPTGASGYAYSAGGFVLDKSNFMVEIVPICPYMRSAKPILCPVAAEIMISAKGAADLIIDGQKIIELAETDVVAVYGDRIMNFVEV